MDRSRSSIEFRKTIKIQEVSSTSVLRSFREKLARSQTRAFMVLIAPRAQEYEERSMLIAIAKFARV